jgi:uncharacterized membrane protein YheB (UPF0754 family)
MEQLWFIIISMAVAATIGGVTNHLAIKMLFHPRVPWRIFGYRVPFTPGLIPKRKDEIAKSLGAVVADYLVTSQGLINLLQKTEFRDKLEFKMEAFVRQWTSSEESIEQLVTRIWGAERAEAGKAALLRALRHGVEKGVGWLWQEQGLASKRLRDIVPDWSDEKREALAQWGTGYLIEEVARELDSPEGGELLRKMVAQGLEQAGGLFGALAGMFMDEERIVLKVKSLLMGRLESPSFREAITKFIDKKIAEWEQMTLAELVEKAAGRDPQAWLSEKAETMLRWDEWLNEWMSSPLTQVLGPRRDWLISKIPWLIAFALRLLQSNVERIVTAIQLPKLVEEQVQQFPIDRLEHIILSVSGKEFRAITWLGALLGGTIGLIQALFMIWYMRGL